MRCSRLALGLVLSVMASAVAAMEPPAEAMKLASLAVGEPEDFKTALDEIEPRADLKVGVAEFPTLDASRKGDPVVALRPSFETRLRGKVSQRGL